MIIYYILSKTLKCCLSFRHICFRQLFVTTESQLYSYMIEKAVHRSAVDNVTSFLIASTCSRFAECENICVPNVDQLLLKPNDPAPSDQDDIFSKLFPLFHQDIYWIALFLLASSYCGFCS